MTRSFVANHDGWCPVKDCPHDHKITKGQRIVKMPIPVEAYGVKTGKWGREYVGTTKKSNYAHADCWQTVEQCRYCGVRHAGSCR